MQSKQKIQWLKGRNPASSQHSSILTLKNCKPKADTKAWLTLTSSKLEAQSHPKGLMMKFTARSLFTFIAGCFLSIHVQAQQAEPIWDEAIGGVDTVFLEEMTAGEIAAAIRGGFTSVIVATGGLEQNGPNVATGKHNYVLRVTADAIARRHGQMLVSSIVQFVPEGNINPPTGHMNFPGTISLRQDTFEALLTDICNSLRQHKFQNIFLIGDSGGNQDGMQNVATALNSEWHGTSTRAYYIPEYYSEDMWSFNFLKQLGYTQLPDETTAFRNMIHTDLHYESIMAVVDPQLVRAQMRLRNGKYEVHGVEIESESELIELGKKLTEYRAEITVKAMIKAVSE